MALKNLTELIQLCENRLGWAVDYSMGVPAYKQRNLEIFKIKQLMKRNSRITLDNLELAVEYSWQKRIPIKSPVGLCYRIDDALRWAYTPKVETDLEERRKQAIKDALASGRIDANEWIQRFQRAYGEGVEFLLKEWEDARRVGTQND